MGRTALRAKQLALAVKQHPEYEDIAELQSMLLASAPLDVSPNKEVLEDIGYHFAKGEDGGLNLPRRIPSATLSPQEMGKIYAAVMATATKAFNKPVSRRQVKRCVAEWMREEAEIRRILKNGADRKSKF